MIEDKMREIVDDVEVLKNSQKALTVNVKTKFSDFRLFFLRDDFLGDKRMTCFTDKPDPKKKQC